MLDRYKKTGGFNQLLTLLETCGPQKQAKFLEIIKQEDPRWAAALSAKMITLERCLQWSDSAIGEVFGAMLEINTAIILLGLAPDVQTRILGTITHVKRRKIVELLETQKPSAGEVAVSHNRFHETLRKLMQDGILRLDKIDPELAVHSDIEERLNQKKDIVGVPSFHDVQASVTEVSPESGVHPLDTESPHLKIVTSLDSQAWSEAGEAKDLKAASQELAILRKRVIDLQKENAAMKQELSIARAKLEQIRKLS